MAADKLSNRFRLAQNEMRNVDGLQPQEAFDELLKYLFFKEHDEGSGRAVSCGHVEDAGLVASEASQIRQRFHDYVTRSVVAPSDWRQAGFRLSDLALVRVHAAFAGIWLLGLGVDVRSSALKTFLTGPVRKGLGIFLTPDEVVREIVSALEPRSGDRIIDLACGSGTFLVEASAHHAKFQRSTDIHLYGVDKSARMALMAELNCSHQHAGTFECAVGDSLGSFEVLPEWYQPSSFDLVLTNPPFGVTNSSLAYSFGTFETCRAADGRELKAQDSEIMFVERALALLRPGGQAGIVLPRSVLTNHRYAEARAALGRVAAVRAIVSLPPETFAATGTQTTTVVLLLEKFSAAFSQAEMIEPVLARIDNVGFDHTGRRRDGSQLPGLGFALHEAMANGLADDRLQILPTMSAGQTFDEVGTLLAGGVQKSRSSMSVRLADIIELASTGRTPPRSAYSSEGLFLVKVGNLSGSGIDWLPRERNFVREPKTVLGRGLERLLRHGDILLTSSAHNAKYIAKKVDVVTAMPAEIGGRASFVGEVMLLRCKDGVDPFRVAAYLRTNAVMQSIQDRVRGQTAHLHVDDVLDLIVDEEIFASEGLSEFARLIETECSLAERANQIAFQQAEIRVSLDEKPCAIETVA